jgi:hypothetical protein
MAETPAPGDLTDAQFERYARHLILDEVGEAGQAKLLASRAKDPSGNNHLPSWHLAWAEGDELFFDESAARAAVAKHDLVLDDLVTHEMKIDRRRIAGLRELHENRELERIFGTLATWHISIEDFDRVQVEGVTGEKMPTRYAWFIDSGKTPAAATEADDDGETPATAKKAKEGARDSGIVEAANVPSIVRALPPGSPATPGMTLSPAAGDSSTETPFHSTCGNAPRISPRAALIPSVPPPA